MSTKHLNQARLIRDKLEAHLEIAEDFVRDLEPKPEPAPPLTEADYYEALRKFGAN